MSQQKEMVSNTIDEVKATVELFYQQKEHEALKKLDVVLGSMMTAVDTIFAYRSEHEEFNIDENKITSTLKDAMNALQDGDMVLLADILQYDFVEYMEELVSGME